MECHLSSGNYHIIASGGSFLFHSKDDLSIRIDNVNGFDLAIILRFLEDDSDRTHLERENAGDHLLIQCFNFKDSGTGLTRPMRIAKIGGKDVYLSFWAYSEGSNGESARYVRYTVFLEK